MEYCPLILRQSTLGGVGVFAGNDISLGDIVHTGRAALIDYVKTKYSPLDNYVFAYNKNISAFAIGYGMVCNQRIPYALLTTTMTTDV